MSTAASVTSPLQSQVRIPRADFLTDVPARMVEEFVYCPRPFFRMSRGIVPRECRDAHCMKFFEAARYTLEFLTGVYRNE
jgi:hypothetical protein